MNTNWKARICSRTSGFKHKNEAINSFKHGKNQPLILKTEKKRGRRLVRWFRKAC